MIVALLLAGPTNAELLINLLEPPREGEIVAAAGVTLQSSVKYKVKTVSNDKRISAYKDEGKLDGKSIVLSGTYGLSESYGIFAGGIFLTDSEFNSSTDVDGQDFGVGGYSSVELLKETKTVVYGQYRIVRWTTDGNPDLDYKGSEIALGLVGISRRQGGLKLYAGPEYIVSTNIESDSDKMDYTTNNVVSGTTLAKDKIDNRKNSFGLRLGFSKPLKNTDMHLFGTAALMHEQSFFLGISTTL